VAEKPSVGRSIRKALSKYNVEVISVRGHVLDVDLPDEYGWNNVDPIRIFDVREFKTVIKDPETYGRLRKFFWKMTEFWYLPLIMIAKGN